MAKYSDIKGFTVQTVSTDPAASAAASGSWASGGDLNTGRNEGGGAGIQTAALMFGGRSPSFQDLTESYDGTSWTEVNDLNTVRYTGGPSIQGTQTATIYFGGARQNPDVAGYNNTETWNGSSWSEVANLSEAREEIGGAGTSTSAVGFAGNPSTATTTAATAATSQIKCGCAHRCLCVRSPSWDDCVRQHGRGADGLEEPAGASPQWRYCYQACAEQILRTARG